MAEVAEGLLIRPLDRRALEGVIDDLVELDRSAQAEGGAAYDTEPWGHAAFRLDLPAKWSLSHVALASERVAGMWIASERRRAGAAYAHRVAVLPGFRGRGVGRALFGHHAASAKAAGLGRVALSVAVDNSGALGFYERLGFTRLRGDQMRPILDAGDVPYRVSGDTYTLRSGRRSYLLHFTLGVPA
jgi:ribosomal protein S18 acetylase RimI-like enzyme